MFGSMFDSMIDVRFLRSPGLDLASTLDSSNRLLDYVSMAPASQIGYSIFDPVQLDMIENRFDIVFEDLDRKSINMDKDRKKNKLIYMAVSILFCDPTSDPLTYCNFR